MALENKVLVSYEEVIKAFEKFDTCGDGKVAYKQLKCIMRELGLDPREAEVTKCVETLKNNQKNDHRMKLGLDPREAEVTKCVETLKNNHKNHHRMTHFTCYELYELVNNRKKDTNLEEIRMAFRLFDVDGKGYISIKDLKQITDELKEEIKQDELEEMIDVVGVKVPGKVSFEEFAMIMKKTSLY
uniref:EF-hand domain-containing protein n=1 Tax=Panagrolaimus sp. PS1159 TaxID=55785 RepID=A0AC35FA72_9BILA